MLHVPQCNITHVFLHVRTSTCTLIVNLSYVNFLLKNYRCRRTAAYGAQKQAQGSFKTNSCMTAIQGDLTNTRTGTYDMCTCQLNKKVRQYHALVSLTTINGSFTARNVQNERYIYMYLSLELLFST